MSRTHDRTLAIGVSIGLLAITLLSGCSSDTASGAGSLSLAETKSPAQLLRNQVSETLPPAAIKTVESTEDISEACNTDGDMRSWRSSALLTVEPKSAWRLGKMLTDLGDTLVEQGWSVTNWDTSGREHNSRFKREGSETAITVLATDAKDDSGKGATLDVVVNGPCVKTDGADSDEVKQLEGRE